MIHKNEVEECSPEYFGEATCYFCQSHDYCQEEYEKHEISQELLEHYSKLAEHYNKKAGLKNE